MVKKEMQAIAQQMLAVYRGILFNHQEFETGNNEELIYEFDCPEFEELRNKLDKEGMFDADHKITLKKYFIDTVAVLTGEDSAAMSDIRRAFARRWPLCKVDYYPVLVQGEKAAADIIHRLKEVDEKGYDAIILAR
ncbi:MAG: hypothetical protein IKU28_03715, partial [Erysipelotrichaceae bacterium]|nr:hypothetical protein [Erysipelotrichaceae bacterium]